MKKYIRNFSIIAHINHGKSTLSHKLIELCNSIKIKNNKILDSMVIEKEKGITIKARNITLFKYYKNKKYELNLIDTPGHADFTNEVIRSLNASEGVLLLIDIMKGIQAQTVSNFNIAKKLNLKIIPIINKIDLGLDNFNQIKLDFKNIFNYNLDNINNKYILCSAKNQIGLNKILKYIIKYIPYPKGDIKKTLEAIILDTWYDTFLGIICLICIKNGFIKINDLIKINQINKNFKIKKIGIFTPNKIELLKISTGQIGWIVLGKIDLNFNPVGCTITNVSHKIIKKKIYITSPQIFNSIFPINNKDFPILEKSIKKLHLNDISFTYKLINSNILGFGFNCGFLGILHMDIIKKRLEIEYNLNILVTLPLVNYKIKFKNKLINITNNININNKIKIYEPMTESIIISPLIYLNNIIKLCNNKRGIYNKINIYNNKVILIYKIPLSEIIINFINKLQAITKGYGSLKYNIINYQIAEIYIVKILINKKEIKLFSYFIHKNKINIFSKLILEYLKINIPKQLFEIVIQIKINSNIIASSIIKPLRKNVLNRCSGGDITRKKKLLKKQKYGKKKLKKSGKIFIEKNLFIKINNFIKKI